MSLGIWLAVAVAAGVVAVILARTLLRRRFASDRQPTALDDLVVQLRSNLAPDVVREVWTTLGDAYGIDPRLIKPEDRLKRLAAIDSWDLGQGGDKLNAWLRTKSLEPRADVETVMELALWVQSAHKV